ncbi:MAG: cory-CC-star protein [Spirochaetales bacterium]
MSEKELSEKLKKYWKRFNEIYDGVFFAPYRSQVMRETQDKEAVFLMLSFPDLLGIPNPVNYYTLELLPHMYERFHEWHKRQGMDHSPLDGFKCC